MSKVTTMVCDVCGTERTQGHHWSDNIEPIEISLKKHSGCQKVAFKGDSCSTCANKIHDIVYDFVLKKSKEK